MSYDLIDLRERDTVELLPGTLLPSGHHVPAGTQGRVLFIDEDAPAWVTVQFGGQYRRPVRLPARRLRRVGP